jgi:hypothetical protein
LGDENMLETFIDSKSKYESNYYKRIQLIFPNLEVGDVIDVVYQIDYKSYELSNCIYLEDDLISLNSKLALRNFSRFELTIYPSKTLKNYEAKTEAGSPVFYWNIKGVGKNPQNEFTAHPQDAPKVAYTLWYPDQQMDYNIVYSNDYDDFHVKTGFKSFTQELSLAGITKEDLTLGENINRIIRYFESDFSWNADRNLPASITPSDCFTKQIMDEKIFFRLIQRYLEENEITYHVGYSSDINEGYFEHGFVALYQLDYRFILIQYADQSEHFLFSPEGKNSYYYMDETPYGCEGNQSIIFTGNRDKVAMSTATIPPSNWSGNKHTANIVLKTTHLSDSTLTLNRKDSFSGQYSMLFRNPSKSYFYKKLNVADTIIKPSEIKEAYPYQVSIKQEDTLPSCFTPFDEQLYAFNAEKLIPNFLFFSSEVKESAGNYSILPFSKQQKYSIYIESPDSITIADNVTNLVKTNSVGTVKTDILQTSAKTIKINYEIKLEKRILATKKENEEYLDLVKEWSNIVGKKWIIQGN